MADEFPELYCLKADTYWCWYIPIHAEACSSDEVAYMDVHLMMNTVVYFGSPCVVGTTPSKMKNIATSLFRTLALFVSCLVTISPIFSRRLSNLSAPLSVRYIDEGVIFTSPSNLWNCRKWTNTSSLYEITFTYLGPKSSLTPIWNLTNSHGVLPHNIQQPQPLLYQIACLLNVESVKYPSRPRSTSELSEFLNHRLYPIAVSGRMLHHCKR